MDDVLVLVKADLGIKSSARDPFLTKMINGMKTEIEGKGITLDLESPEDQMLLNDYAAWRYRHRSEDAGLPEHLRYRIRNRIVKGRANG